MIKTENNAKKSHIAHEKHIKSLLHEKRDRFFVHNHKDSAAYLINIRTLELIEPLLKKESTWLTVGDYNGFEAMYLHEKGQNATASDISDAFLIEALNRGFIKKFQKENVEALSFEDNTFDYVMCREAFHHFPRAYLGFYEMIRVSKKGALMIEPLDILGRVPLLQLLKNIFDIFNPMLINKIWKNRFSWETVGNYVFKISEREVEKIAMGIGLPCIAFKGINLILYPKVELMETPLNQNALRSVLKSIKFLDILSKLRIVPYNTLCAIAFKQTPDKTTLNDLERMGYQILHLPENPYLN